MECPGVYQNCNRRSSILFKIGHKNVRFLQIEEGGLRIKFLTLEEFENQFHPLDYDLPTALKRFKSFAKLHGITEGAAEVLCQLSGTDDFFVKESKMEGEVKANLDKAKDLKDGKKPAAAAKKPAAAAKKPAAAAAEKKPAAKKDASKGETRGRKAEWKEKEHKIGDANAVGRGAIKTFVDHATELKKFTLADLMKKFKNLKDFSEERVLRYFTWCRAKGIFVEGK